MDNARPRGDEIEFFVPLSGLLNRAVETAIVPGQPGLAAIELPDLGVLTRFSKMLRLPLQLAPPVGAARDGIEFRVPRLGAYLLNKAVTFPHRQPAQGETTNPKRAKDLLYPRDLAAAGPTLARAIEADLADMIRDAPTLQSTVDRAASNLEWAMQSDLEIELVAHMLVEREPGRALEAARRDVRGFLPDVYEVVSAHRSPATERSPEDDDG